ncbi:YcaO-like family protein [Streptomyces aurantiacus]|uniref:YcaO-like family protein n=1 Tax=Streptomyces aurantiacus TaxID=47760 RepID=UPI0005681986|nr:YcaO-like family protein [Streptomyces aurantiacus]
MRKVFWEGTHRVRSPHETWDLVSPRLSGYGITRVADVTRLDRIGLPVFMVVRPLSKSLTVAQGKGVTEAAARVSGVMESIEFWHAESACPEPVHSDVAATDLRSPYLLEGLPQYPGSLLTSSMPLHWIEAQGMLSGAPVLVPRCCVELNDLEDGSWCPPALYPSSNGLAGGNCRAEAAVHALYELLERDSVARRHLDSGRSPGVDADTVPDPCCAELIRRIRTNDVWLEIEHVTNRWGVPCFVAHLWSDDLPVVCSGSGAHLDPAIALSRALSEAAQTRLTVITGTRDDVDEVVYATGRRRFEAPPKTSDPVSWSTATAPFTTAFDDIDRELDWLCGLVRDETGGEPALVDLSTAADFSVVKVLAEHLDFRLDIPFYPEEAAS